MIAQKKERRAHTLNEFCQRWNMSRAKAYELIKNRKLRAVKVGSRTYITAEAEDEFVASLPALHDAEAR